VSLAPSPWHTNNGLNDRQGGDPARWFKWPARWWSFGLAGSCYARKHSDVSL
jgi:hypothetical protein